MNKKPSHPLKQTLIAVLAVLLTQAASYGGVTVDFDPTGEITNQFSVPGYGQSASGGLAGSIGINLPGGTIPVSGFDGSQSLSFAANTYANGASFTVGAFFKMSTLNTTEVMRLGLNNGGSTSFGNLPYAAIQWNGSVAKLDARAVASATTFALSTGQWYYFEAIFTRSGNIITTNVSYVISLCNANTNGVIGSLVAKYSVTNQGAGLANTNSLNKAIYGAFRQSESVGIMDNFYVSTNGETQVPPQLVSLNPADNAISVPVSSNLVATFDRTIQAGTGSISIKKASDNSTVESFDVTSSSRLTFSGAQLTIDPTSDLPGGTSLYVTIPAGAVKDLANISFLGATNTGDWNFDTVATVIRDLFWRPATSNWNTADVNWDSDSNAVADTAFAPGDRVYFTDSGLAQPNVQLGLAVAPTSLTVSNTAGTYQLSGSPGGYITGTASVVKQGSSTLVLATDNDYTGSTLIAGGTLQVGNNGGTGTLGTGNITNNATLRFNRTNDLTVNAIAGTGSLHQDGSGVLTLAGSNTLSGGVTINAGILAVSNTIPLANVSGITIAGGATLRADVVDAVVDAPITLGGINTTSIITAPIAPLTSGANSTPQFFTLNGVISGNGNVIFKGLNPYNWGGTIQLGAQSTYSGSTLLTCEDDIVAQFNPSGTDNQNIQVRLGTNNALPTTTVVTLDGGDGTLAGRFCDIFLAGKDQTIAGLNNIPRDKRFQRVINPDAATPCTLTVSNTVNCEFSGNLGGSGGPGLGSGVAGNNFSLVKSGSAVFTLSRTNGNNYANGTTINGGTLIVTNTSGSATGTGDVTINSGGTLGGSGTIGGAVNVNSGGILAAGSSIGTLTITGAVSVAGTIVAEIAGGPSADLLNFIGGATFNSGSILTVVNTGGIANGETFNLFDGLLSGTFTTVNLPGGPGHWNTANLYSNGEITFANAAPVAKNLTNGVSQGGSATLLIIGGKEPPTDANLDTMTISLPSGTTANGASVSTDGTSVTVDYSGVGSYTGVDTFSYTVTDSFGASDTRTVTVLITSATGANLISATAGGGNAYLSYAGIPGTNYALDKATSLTPPNWVAQVTNTADGSGRLNYTNLLSTWPTNDFFRTRYVP